MLHYHPKVRRISFEILRAIAQFSSTAFLFDKLNKMYVNAYKKIELLYADGSLQSEEEDELANEIRAAKRAQEKEKEVTEALRAMDLKSKAETAIDFREAAGSITEDLTALPAALLQPVEEIVKQSMSGLNTLFQGVVDAIDDEEQRHYMRTESPVYE
jgi:superfamily II RNA helicase